MKTRELFDIIKAISDSKNRNQTNQSRWRTSRSPGFPQETHRIRSGSSPRHRDAPSWWWCSCCFCARRWGARWGLDGWSLRGCPARTPAGPCCGGCTSALDGRCGRRLWWCCSRAAEGDWPLRWELVQPWLLLSSDTTRLSAVHTGASNCFNLLHIKP